MRSPLYCIKSQSQVFPQYRVFECKIGLLPLVCMEGIWKAKQSLKMDCRWRVGKGGEINRWTDYLVSNHRQWIHSVHEVEMDVNQKVE